MSSDTEQVKAVGVTDREREWRRLASGIQTEYMLEGGHVKEQDKRRDLETVRNSHVRCKGVKIEGFPFTISGNTD